MRDLRIMVVEDDPDTLEFMSLFLGIHDYQAVLYHTTAGISEEILEQQPDLIILDLHIHTPLAGWYVFKAMRALPVTAHIPVLLYSTSRTFLRSHRREILSHHGDILEKPFIPDELLAKIEALTIPA